MLKIHEVITADGALSPVSVSVEAGALVWWEAGEGRPLPSGSLEAVMARFGGPLDPAATLVEVGRLGLPAGGLLRQVRHLAHYDVIARDFLVLDRPGAPSQCALAITVAGALEHLARAAAGKPEATGPRWKQSES